VSVPRVVVLTDGRPHATEHLAAILARAPAGSVAIQIREKQLDGGPLLALARDVIALGAPVWINDRIDVALAADAHGVHLPERGMAIGDARRIAPALAIGCSRHDRSGVLAAADADVIHLGPIWETPGKGPPLGSDALRVRAELPASVRLVAVGGIDSPERAREALAAGADAVAVIRAAWRPNAAELVAAIASL